MSSPIFLGIKTQNPVIGLASPNPNVVNGSVQPTQPIKNQSVGPGKWNQGQGIPVVEVPWHKATPDMKNIK